MHTRHDIGVATHIGRYSDGIEVAEPARWFALSGTPGMLPDGTLPDSFEGQAEQAWTNVLRALTSAGMDASHLVKITQYLLRAEDVPAYGAIRARFLGDARPASTLLIVPALVWPNMLIEIEVWAADTAATNRT